MKILFSPCHYIFGPNSGSESSWSYSIADGIAKVFPDSVVITGFQKKDENGKIHTKNYQIIELQSHKKVVDMSLKNALIFNWQYFVKTCELLSLEMTEKSGNSELYPY